MPRPPPEKSPRPARVCRRGAAAGQGQWQGQGQGQGQRQGQDGARGAHHRVQESLFRSSGGREAASRGGVSPTWFVSDW